MKSPARLIALLLVGLIALSGCAAVRSILSSGSGSGDAPTEASSEDVAAAPSAPRFTFYDSWASW